MQRLRRRAPRRMRRLLRRRRRGRRSGCCSCGCRSRRDRDEFAVVDLGFELEFLGEAPSRPRGAAAAARATCQFASGHLVGQLEHVVGRVLELGRPEQRVERADLDADPAVHAQREVDREAVEHVAGARARRPRVFGGRRLFVRVDVDAPVGALAGAEHADGAVLFLQRDDAAGTRRQIRLLVRVLLRGRGFSMCLSVMLMPLHEAV